MWISEKDALGLQTTESLSECFFRKPQHDHKFCFLVWRTSQSVFSLMVLTYWRCLSAACIALNYPKFDLAAISHSWSETVWLWTNLDLESLLRCSVRQLCVKLVRVPLQMAKAGCVGRRSAAGLAPADWGSVRANEVRKRTLAHSCSCWSRNLFSVFHNL